MWGIGIPTCHGGDCIDGLGIKSTFVQTLRTPTEISALLAVCSSSVSHLYSSIGWSGSATWLIA